LLSETYKRKEFYRKGREGTRRGQAGDGGKNGERENGEGRRELKPFLTAKYANYAKKETEFYREGREGTRRSKD